MEEETNEIKKTNNMTRNQMIKTVKEIHKEDICLFKIGNFYHCYNRDAYIISHIFDYKIKDIESGNAECGFPINSLNKIIAKLEEFKINYLVIDKRNNFEVDMKANYKDLNRYQDFYFKSNKFINYKNRIQKINNFLLDNMENKDFRKILGSVEEVIYERREI